MPKSSLSKTFNTPIATLWAILTEAKYSPDYMFNCTLDTTWQVGSDITWQGEYQGYKAFQKGKVLAYQPMNKVSYTTFDPNAGLVDLAENYIHVSYHLNDKGDQTELVIKNETFDGNGERMAHIKQGWQMVLDKLEQLTQQT